MARDWEAINAHMAAEAVTGKILGFIWAGAFYCCGVIWFALELLRRWDRASSLKRRNSSRHACGFFSIIAAFLLATAWPLVWVYLLMYPGPPSL